MATKIPAHHAIAIGEGGPLARPHSAARAVAVGQQEGRAVTLDFVVNDDAVAVDLRHVREFSR